MSVTPCPKLDFLLSPDRYPNDSWERTLVDTRKDRKKKRDPDGIARGVSQN
jgi:hypothetical protein